MHVLHPVFVHFTVALLITAALLLFVARVHPWAEKCRVVGNWNLIIGAISLLPTVGAGFYAFNTVAHDAPSHLAMIDHRNFAVVTALVWCVLAIWRIWVLRQKRRSGWPFFWSVFLAVFLLGITGFKGGELVFQHGLGVSSLPSSSSDGKSDGHGHGHEAVEEHPAKPMAKAPPKHDNSDGHPHEAVEEHPPKPTAKAPPKHDNSDGHPH